jgi:hypothetical protein
MRFGDLIKNPWVSEKSPYFITMFIGYTKSQKTRCYQCLCANGELVKFVIGKEPFVVVDKVAFADIVQQAKAKIVLSVNG